MLSIAKLSAKPLFRRFPYFKKRQCIKHYCRNHYNHDEPAHHIHVVESKISVIQEAFGEYLNFKNKLNTPHIKKSTPINPIIFQSSEISQNTIYIVAIVYPFLTISLLLFMYYNN